MSQADTVVFRKWKENGEMIALFPELPADLGGDCCESFEHVGQHGGADFHHVIRQTTPCSPDDAAALAAELTDHRLRSEADKAGESDAPRGTPTACVGPSQDGVNQPQQVGKGS